MGHFPQPWVFFDKSGKAEFPQNQFCLSVLGASSAPSARNAALMQLRVFIDCALEKR